MGYVTVTDGYTAGHAPTQLEEDRRESRRHPVHDPAGARRHLPARAAFALHRAAAAARGAGRYVPAALRAGLSEPHLCRALVAGRRQLRAGTPLIRAALGAGGANLGS